ncbi:ankyrin repeat domain-containing protein 50 [Aplysia californica]|uniref:Ankyrin repeat domain-containing protein 50 n=1 Tax=Aplysia californica TaxID=6500 RepID=A0ABM1ACT1_APLCA|nr:ankyrin repeat domain-containing protein 50 [Aplysia californica]
MYSHGPGGDSGYEDEQNELHTACERGTLDDILVCLGSQSHVQWYHDGQTALHVCVMSERRDKPEVLRMLLEHGADVNDRTTGQENTALHLAVMYGTFPKDFDTVMVFLESNMDLSQRNKALRTPYDCAVATGQYELAGAIDGSMSPQKAREFYAQKLGERYGPYIIEAVLDSDEQKLHASLDMGGDPNLVNKHKAGAIHYAVTHSHLPIYDTLSTLLQHGASPDLRDEEGDTALNLVIKDDGLRRSGHMTRCVQLLVDAGAGSDFRDLDGKDAIALAEDRGYDDVIAILRAEQTPPAPPPLPRLPRLPPTPQPSEPEPAPEEKETEESPAEVEPDQQATPREDPNVPNADGLYPLHVATTIEPEVRRHTRVNALLEQGATVSAQTLTTGDTALHFCAERDLGSTARLLLQHHIDYTVKNNHGKTAYEIAEELGHGSVVEAIEEKQKEVQDNWKRAGKKAKFCTIL